MNTYLRSWALDDITISRSDRTGRLVEAYAAVFDTPAEISDQHGRYVEDINRSAFNRQIGLGIDRVGVYYNHAMNAYGQPSDVYSVPIGTPVDIRADGRGLRTATRYNDGPDADRILEAIRNDAIKGYSFRGRIYKSTPDRVPRVRPGDDLPRVTRMELGLTEYGPTPNPAYVEASILAVRSIDQIAAGIVGLSDEDRAELIRMLSSATPLGDQATSTATSEQSELGAEDQHAERAHSGRQADIARKIRAARVLRGIQ